MSKGLDNFRRLMDLSIEGAIDCYRRTGVPKRAMVIHVRDLDVQRVTLKLRSTVLQYGKAIKVKLTYSSLDRAFHFTLDLDEVVMTATQATKYTELMQARKEAA